MKTSESNLGILTLIALGSFLLFSCNDDDAGKDQLIVNGDVEAGATFPNSWWYNKGNNQYEVTWTDQESYSTKRSLQISSPATHTSGFAFWAQTITSNLPTGKGVTLSVRIKGDLVGEGVSIAIRGDKTTGPSGSGEQFITTQGSESITGTFDWTDHSITLSSVAATTKSITIYFVFLPNTKGKVYFDDVSLTF